MSEPALNLLSFKCVWSSSRAAATSGGVAATFKSTLQPAAMATPDVEMYSFGTPPWAAVAEYRGFSSVGAATPPSQSFPPRLPETQAQFWTLESHVQL